MAVVTTYTCDKCGASQKEKTQFWTVAVVASHYPEIPNVYDASRSIGVCRKCLESLGIHCTKKAAPDGPQPPTVEELIRQIMELCGIRGAE